MSEPIWPKALAKPSLEPALTELLNQQLITHMGGHYQATLRWHAALARAAKYFAETEETQEDIRLPITRALLDTCGTELSEETLLAAVEVMVILMGHTVGEPAPEAAI